MNYDPVMGSELEAKLRAEIAAFDEVKTKAELEENAKPKKDAPGYAEWLDSKTRERDLYGGHFLHVAGSPDMASAEPDLLSEDDAVKFIKPTFSKQIVLATLEIKELLSFRESQVWTAVMKNGLSVKECAERLHVGERTVETYIARAKAKVIEHFKDVEVE